MAKKRSQKRQGRASSKGSKQRPKPRPRKAPEKKFIQSRKSKTIPRQLRPLKESAKYKQYKLSKPAPAKARKLERTQAYKSFAKKFGRKSDKKYWKEVKKHWKNLYEQKRQPANIARINVQKRFQRDTRNRFYKTKRTYWGTTKTGKPVKRYLWRDKLTGQWLKSRAVGARLLKAMEPDLIKSYMQKKGLKNYQKARKRYLKEIKNKSLGKIMDLYSTSP